MLFPIGDDQVKGGHYPWFSYGLIGFCILIFVVQAQFADGLFCRLGAVPNAIAHGENLYTLISSIFLHANFQHLLGNMLFLWVFADNVEANVNSRRFLTFFFIGGAVAALAHSLVQADPSIDWCCALCEGGCDMGYCEGSVPMVGASGAISAVLGAYLVMFPLSRIKMLFLFFFFRVPAFVFLIFWILLQLNNGLSVVGEGGGGVAWWAHIGGFAFGLLSGVYFRGLSGFIGLGEEEED